ncbi:MAG: IS110 family transposase, partial [Fluviicola sp.]
KMKTLLHLAALRVIQLEGEMRDYFIRKVSEGKNKMSVINAIRNKILARVCSCIKNEKMYEKSLDLS